MGTIPLALCIGLPRCGKVSRRSGQEGSEIYCFAISTLRPFELAYLRAHQPSFIFPNIHP
jgi:hypothetical protein